MPRYKSYKPQEPQPSVKEAEVLAISEQTDLANEDQVFVEIPAEVNSPVLIEMESVVVKPTAWRVKERRLCGITGTFTWVNAGKLIHDPELAAALIQQNVPLEVVDVE